MGLKIGTNFIYKRMFSYNMEVSYPQCNIVVNYCENLMKPYQRINNVLRVHLNKKFLGTVCVLMQQLDEFGDLHYKDVHLEVMMNFFVQKIAEILSNC